MGDEAYQTKGLDKDFGFRVNERFYLRSKLPMQRVMEAVGANNVVLKKYARGRVSQQFYFDPVSKTIKSQQWRGHSMEYSGNNLRLTGTNSRWNQLFRWTAPYLRNEKQQNKVADVQGAHDSENRNILMWNLNKGVHQQWDLIYAKDWVKEPTKGQLNKEFGLKVDTTFYIVSRLPKGRYLDFLGRNLVIKTQNGRRTQEFYFHQPSKTIRSRQHNWSFDIQSSGRSTNMQLWSTNSQWW
jgi:hypothetical protein